MSEAVLSVQNLRTYLGQRWILDNLNLTVNRGEIVAIIGPSGTGKTILLRSILRLQAIVSGSIKVFGRELIGASESVLQWVQERWGVMFQSSALFSSLCVLENVLYPLKMFSHLSDCAQQKIALFKIALSGLPQHAVEKYPSELSGGMKKRAALARAIALDPQLIFLDEPTAGLDPNSASEMDELVLFLRDSLGLTVIMVTHDLDSLWQVPDRVLFLADGKILASAPMAQLIHSSHPVVQTYFSGSRHYKRPSREQDGYKS